MFSKEPPSRTKRRLRAQKISVLWNVFWKSKHIKWLFTTFSYISHHFVLGRVGSCKKVAWAVDASRARNILRRTGHHVCYLGYKAFMGDSLSNIDLLSATLILHNTHGLQRWPRYHSCAQIDTIWIISSPGTGILKWPGGRITLPR